MPPIKSGVLRGLLIIASPSNLPIRFAPIPDAERSIAKEALRAIGPEAIELTVLESGAKDPPSIDRLREELAKSPHIVHVLCHGEMTENYGVLYIEDADGLCYGLTGKAFAEALQSARSHPRLVMLASCESASVELIL